MDTIPCNVCGSDQTTILFILPDYLLGRPLVHSTLVQCQQCGLIFQSPRLSQEELNSSYPDEYEPFASVNQGKSSRFMQWIKFHGIQKRIQAVTRHASGGKLLDVGCAGGIFLHALQKYPSWELFGVEPNKKTAEFGRRSLGLNIFNGTLEQAAFPDDFFSVVTLWDVLEHLPDPGNTLSEIRRILKPSGLVALRLPNYGSIEAKIFKKFWVGLDAPRHLYVFNKRNIGELFQKKGFRVVELRTGIGSYPNFLLSIRFFLTDQKINPTIKRIILSILGYLPVRALLAPFFYFVDHTGYGSSMIVIGSKETIK